MKKLPILSLVSFIGFTFTPCAVGATYRLDAPKIFERSVTDHLRLSPNGTTVELETGELFEDDGPAAGRSYQTPKNQEVLTETTWIKKDLIIPNPAARAAFLIVLAEDYGEVMINNIPRQFGPNESGRKGYQTLRFDPQVLQAGRNEIVLRHSGNLAIARDDEFALGSRSRTRHPNRSAKSTDGGKTWNYDHLGPDGKLDGEYGVRIFLDHYRPRGTLLTPVMDVANLEGKATPAPVHQIGPVRIAIDADQGTKGRILVRARSGTTYSTAEKGWSEWEKLSASGGTLAKPRGRFVQLSLELTTDDGLQSPRLKSVLVTAAPERSEDWTSRLHVLEEHNPEIVRTSIPFEYEPLNHPRLRKLREQYQFDKVVEGSGNEIELMLRLAQWACNHWDWPNHIMEQYPPWDALEILNQHPDGTPVGGFCHQFNLVFLQACESFGFNGRAVSISQGRLQEKHPGGGHEIVELWSNQWRKWVYVDGALAWYVVDEKSGTPLSIWELRERQLALLRGETAPPVRLVDAVRTKNAQFKWNGLLGSPAPLNWYSELRMIPRSNFLQEKSPLPLNQGTEEWAWTGSYVWTDDEVPAGLLFGNRVAKRTDFEWTLNQAHYLLEPLSRTGVIKVHLDTETPSFETYLAQVDGGVKQPVHSGFEWQLHSGKNSLRVTTRNLAGREGITSSIVAEYQ